MSGLSGFASGYAETSGLYEHPPAADLSLKRPVFAFGYAAARSGH